MNDCVEWTGSFDARGYGRVKGSAGKYITAHRFVWEEAHGPVPAGMVATLTCGNKACVNLDHIEAATFSEIHAKRNRDIVACPQGHPYPPPVAGKQRECPANVTEKRAEDGGTERR